MGLYGERVGAFHLWTATAEIASNAKGHLNRLQRGQVSQPPRRGAKIAATILRTPDIYQEWLSDIQQMSSRIQNMRKALYDKLISLDTPGSWEHICSQVRVVPTNIYKLYEIKLTYYY